VKCVTQGDSGKTTLLQQLKIIHGIGFEVNEMDHYREMMMKFIVCSIKRMLESEREQTQGNCPGTF
jgi:hypothetical protein